MKPTQIPTNFSGKFIFRNDGFSDAFNTLFSGPSGKKLIEKLTKRSFKAGVTGQTYRVINHWDNYGLTFNKNKSGEWREFSISEIVWFEIIKKLRDFGVPLAHIKEAKDAFFGPKNTKEKMEIFLFYIATSLSTKSSNYVVYTGSDFIEFCSDHEYLTSFKFGSIPPTHILISLSGITAGLLGKNSSDGSHLEILSLNNDEDFLINQVRSMESGTVTTKIKNSNIERVESIETYDKDNAIKHWQKFLNDDKAFGDFTVSKENGRIVFGKFVKKTKPNTG